MKKETKSSGIITDERAEGSPPSPEVKETAHLKQTVTIPAVRVSRSDSPSGETGVLPAVILQAEGLDNVDAQDASRTTAETTSAPATTEALNLRAPSALIVEDTHELAEVIQGTLQRMNVLSAIESHGQRALARFHEMKPDVVLLDIGLPDMTGWKLLEAIKDSSRETKKMPSIIIITAYGDAANRLIGKLQNVYSYLVKPFTADEIERAVMQALSGKVG
jgi:CheY-like chemotaxis protein